MNQYKELLNAAIEAAIEAGNEIMSVYNSNFEIDYKSDTSPITLADKKAHHIIFKTLSKYNFPIVSEEGDPIPFDHRKNWDFLWIVDPLDGTKEFIKRNHEFTVNIALIKNNVPVLGVVYVPVDEVLYYAAEGIGAFKKQNQITQKLPLDSKNSSYVVVSSRSHINLETQNFINKLSEKHPQLQLITKGSSIKICMVAEGSANCYPRFSPTMEWDIAAGHAIVKYAGKKLIDCSTDLEMIYNRADMTNNSFVVT